MHANEPNFIPPTGEPIGTTVGGTAQTPPAVQQPPVPPQVNASPSATTAPNLATTPTETPAPAGRRSGHPGGGAVIGAAIVGVLIGGILMMGIGWAAFSVFGIAYSESTGGTVTENTVPAAPITGEAVDTVAVAEKAMPSVVSIAVTTEVTGLFGSASVGSSSGSGVVISDDGYIITNFHVIAGGTSFDVTVGNETYPAKVVGEDESSDIAVLKVDATGLTPIELGSSNDLRVGEFVMAVGSPFGLEQSVSTGIVSGLGRSTYMESQTTIAAYIDLIQTDAAINPGNSGGALVNASAQLVGINTLIESTSGSSAGVGFAIPVETAVDIANQLIEDGSASHAFLGVSTQTVTAQIANMYGLGVDHGAYVVLLTEGSPADLAGMQVGDIITSIGDQTIDGMGDVFTAVRSHRAGDIVEVVAMRGTTEKTFSVTLVDDAAFSGNRPEGTTRP